MSRLIAADPHSLGASPPLLEPVDPARPQAADVEVSAFITEAFVNGWVLIGDEASGGHPLLNGIALTDEGNRRLKDVLAEG